MKSGEIRKRFLEFFEERGHAVVPSSSLVPEGDSSTLFISAGMQPLVPYLLGQKHPKGNRLVNVQKCIRTGDIDEVGDESHLTFFEMLGNWSLGDPTSSDGLGETGYFKEEAISYTLTFFTDTRKGLGLDKKRMYITVFEGDDPSTPEPLRTGAPKDEVSKEAWLSLGIPKERIYYMPASSNWWSPGENGPCGPDTEIFYDVTENGIGKMTKEEFIDAESKNKVIEIGNDVFIEYEKKDGKIAGKLKQQNVDFGGGFERLVMVVQGKNSVFETDLFTPLIEAIPNEDIRERRIIADHIRAAVFAVGDGVVPSNTDRGYIVRRLIRRAMRYTTDDVITSVIMNVITNYKDAYPELENKEIVAVLQNEMDQFRTTLARGIKAFEKGERDAFVLFTTYGFPLELTLELAQEEGEEISVEKFDEQMKEHQEKSRTAGVGKFKGGLADSSEETIKLHTAHHLLLAALQNTLGESVKQRGSNITPERLRIDFSFDRKLTDEEKEAVEKQVNKWIQQGLAVERKEMSLSEAEKIGAEMEFGQKYPDVVSVYFIQDSGGEVISKEFCGGPHVKNTSEIGGLQIKSEKASSAGVRRIKAIINPRASSGGL